MAPGTDLGADDRAGVEQVSPPSQTLWSVGHTGSKKSPNDRRQVISERGSDLSKSTRQVRILQGWNPGLCWRHGTRPGLRGEGSAGAHPACFPPVVWGHDAHPGGEDELHRLLPARVRAHDKQGPRTLQAVSAPGTGAGGGEGTMLPSSGLLCRGGALRACWGAPEGPHG